MKVKTSDLTGSFLDYAVAMCEQSDPAFTDTPTEWHLAAYSTDWAQGGPLIERERICLIDQGGDYWQALFGWTEMFGDTPLVAAMRCYVASKLGDEVNVPEEIR